MFTPLLDYMEELRQKAFNLALAADRECALGTQAARVMRIRAKDYAAFADRLAHILDQI